MESAGSTEPSLEPAGRLRVSWCGRAYGMLVELSLKPAIHIFGSSDHPH